MLTFPRTGLDWISPTTNWKGSVALPGISCGVFASTHSLLHLNSPFRALLKHLYSLEQETKQETSLFVIPEEAQRPFLPLECTICLLFHRNPAPNSEFQIGGAPTEEHPLTSRPGSRDCQGRAQMDALLSAFLEFLPDCSHMDPDSRSFVAPAPSRPRGLQAPMLPGGSAGISGAQRGTWEADPGNFLLPGTP